MKGVMPRTSELAAMRSEAAGRGLNSRVGNDGWLTLDMAIEDCEPQVLLERNARLSGPARFVLGADGGPLLRADVSPGENAMARFHDALEAMGAALGSAEAERGFGPPDHLLKEACAACGWPFMERDGGALSFALDVRGAAYRAQIESGSDDAARAWVDLGEFPSQPGASHEAVCVLALRAGNAVRLMRPAMGENGALRFEAGWTSQPTAEEIGHALSALSVACRLCAEEFEALRDETLAGAFLGQTRQQQKGNDRPWSWH